MARASFLHTADLHLSRPFGFLPPQIAEERRRDQRRTLSKIVDLALERDVNFLLVAGDLFDRPDPDPSDIEAVTENFRRLTEAGKLIFAIPGNHDHCSMGGFWRRFNMDGVRVFTEPEYQSEILGDLGIIVTGIAFDRENSSRRAFEGLNLQSDLPAVILVHSSYESFEGQIERYHPFSAAEIAQLPAAYIALGHYHRLNFINSNGVIACYPGTPEGISFDAPETEERYVIIGKIEDDGKVATEQVPVNRRIMRSVEIDCTSFDSIDALLEAIRKVCNPAALVEIRLTGTPPGELIPALQEVGERFKDSCYWLSVDHSGLVTSTEVDDDDRTIRGLFKQYLIKEIEKTNDPERRRLLLRALDLGLAALGEE